MLHAERMRKRRDKREMDESTDDDISSMSTATDIDHRSCPKVNEQEWQRFIKKHKPLPSEISINEDEDEDPLWNPENEDEDEEIEYEHEDEEKMEYEPAVKKRKLTNNQTKKSNRKKGQKKRRGRKRKNARINNQNYHVSRIYSRRLVHQEQQQQQQQHQDYIDQVWAYKVYKNPGKRRKYKCRMYGGLNEFNEDLVQVNDIGEMKHACKYCGALKFKAELSRKKICCKGGKMKLQPFKPPPNALYSLLTGDDENAKWFQKNIYKINSALSLCSAKMTQRRLSGGLQKFILEGKVVESAPKFVRDDNNCDKSMIYTFAQHLQLEKRLGLNFLQQIRNDPRTRTVLKTLQNVLIRQNWLTHAYKNVYEKYSCLSSIQKFCIVMRRNVKPGEEGHYKQYVPAETEKIATLVPVYGEKNPRLTHQEMIMTDADGIDRTINEENAYYDPLNFVLFHPYGEPGYSADLKKPKKKKKKNNSNHNNQTNNDDDDDDDDVSITARDYYRYKLFEREGMWNPYIHGRRLFEAFVTNQWAKISQIQLNQLKSKKMQKV